MNNISDYTSLEIPDDYGVIYEYYFPTVGKAYIGQTKNLIKRHESHSRSDSPFSSYIRHGDYIITVLDLVPEKDLDEAERRYISVNNTLEPNGYNKSIGGRDEDIKQRQHSPVPSVPSRIGTIRFASDIVELDGAMYLKIPQKYRIKGYVSVGESMNVWIEKKIDQP